MGYNILNISELNSLDFTNLSGTKETVRKSIDGSKFIIEGDSINNYTLEQMQVIVQGSEWVKNMTNE